MSIEKLSFKEKSLLFAKLSSIAYNNIKEAKSQAKKLGFTTTEFYEKDGAQAYRFMNKTDLVIACRGTQPTEFNDLKADLKAIPVMAETVGRVHIGFKTEVDDLWPMIEEDINRKTNVTKTLWFCGHSLGAAMATIMASRAKHNVELFLLLLWGLNITVLSITLMHTEMFVLQLAGRCLKTDCAACGWASRKVRSITLVITQWLSTSSTSKLTKTNQTNC